jgi:site-specific DNA-adenine methylase
MTTLKPFFTYFGGKWRAAKHYPQPRYDAIIEPFAGAAGYALRYPTRQVTLIDRNEKIAAIWQYLVRVSESEIRSLPLTFATVDDLVEVPQEARWLIGFWLNKGCAAPRKTPSRWMRQGMHATSFWGEAIRARIAAQIGSIRHWRVIHGSYDDAPSAEATWFVDPPYEKAGHNYAHPLRDDEYAKLAAWCRSRQGQVLVCEAGGATWLPFQSFRSIKANQSSRGGKKSVEVLWTNAT